MSSSEGNRPLPVENIRQTRPKDLTKGPFAVAKLLVDSFSGTGRRSPESSVAATHADAVPKTRHVRLITVGVSHFCEKVRWALDLKEADPTSDILYTEDAHPPGLAAFATVPASDGKASRTPMIVLDEPIPCVDTGRADTVMYDSTTILQTLCPELYPPEAKDAIIKFEEDLGERLGATARCFAYHHFLSPEYFPLLSKMCSTETSKVEAVLFRTMMPRGLEKGMRKSMGVNDESAASSLAAIKEVFDEVSARLDGGTNEYLFDSKTSKVGFTAADLTFASLASPLIGPPELLTLSGGAENVDKFPPQLKMLKDELRSTPAGKHVLRMYRNHRFGVGRGPRINMDERAVILKSVGRNRLPWLGLAIAAGTVTAVAVGVERTRRSRL